MSKQKFLVKPQSSAGDKDIVSNIMSNMDSIKVWAKRATRSRDSAFIISAGPSTKKFLKDYKHLLEKNNGPVFCIKHALPLLAAAEIVPDYCVVLDPRAIDDTSTLGFTRKSLYNTASKKTKFFVASMTHPSVTEHLMSSGYDVIGWHALTPEMQSPHLPDSYRQRLMADGSLLITGGTSSGTRSIELANVLFGIQKVTCVGFDSSFDVPKPTSIKDLKGKQRYLKITVDEKPYYTTGELVAQAQDFERLVSNGKHPSEVKIFDTGSDTSLVNALVRKNGNFTIGEKDWSKMYE